MAISNTSVLIKRSSSTAKPGSLLAGELAYSYVSNTLFLGTPAGGVINVAGQLYTSAIDSSTADNVASTLVKRDSNGAFSGRFYGIANTALTWNTARSIGVSGEATGSILVDGSSDANIPLTLTNTNVVAGNYGGSTAIPVLNVAANGRVISISNTALSTSFNLQANTGTTTFNNGNTLIVVGAANSGILTTVSTNQITLSTDTTFVRGNTSIGPQTITSALNISGNVAITGNLIVTGNVISQGVSQVVISDPLIYLAGNNYTSDVVDIGFVGNYYDGTNERHTGFFRDATIKQYYLFDNYIPELSGNNSIDILDPSFRVATLRANLIASQANATILNASVANLTSLTINTALGISSGGTGAQSYDQNGLVTYNGTQFVTAANVTAYTNLGSASYLPVITTDSFGRVTNISNTLIQIDASQTVSGILPIARGGTNNNTFTPGALTFFDGTKLASFANSVFSATGSGAGNNTITSISVDSYGRVTNATWQQISGLTVSQGGTGASSFTGNGIVYGNGTQALQATSAAGTASDQSWSNQILTVTNAGVPVWTTNLDGGTF